MKLVLKNKRLNLIDNNNKLIYSQEILNIKNNKNLTKKGLTYLIFILYLKKLGLLKI